MPLAEDAGDALAAEDPCADPDVGVALEPPTEVPPPADAADDVSVELETQADAADEDTAVPLVDGGALVGHPHGLADDETPPDPDELPLWLLVHGHSPGWQPSHWVDLWQAGHSGAA